MSANIHLIILQLQRTFKKNMYQVA